MPIRRGGSRRTPRRIRFGAAPPAGTPFVVGFAFVGAFLPLSLRSRSRRLEASPSQPFEEERAIRFDGEGVHLEHPARRFDGGERLLANDLRAEVIEKAREVLASRRPISAERANGG